jgi:hypothetical protein
MGLIGSRQGPLRRQRFGTFRCLIPEICRPISFEFMQRFGRGFDGVDGLAFLRMRLARFKNRCTGLSKRAAARGCDLAIH